MPASSRCLATGGALLALALLAPALAGTASAAPGQPGTPPPHAGSTSVIEPVIDADSADPDILLVDGVHHAYATDDEGQDVQHQTSTDLVNWTPQPDAAPTLGDWVGPCSPAPGGATDNCVWAPEVTAVDASPDRAPGRGPPRTPQRRRSAVGGCGVLGAPPQHSSTARPGDLP